MKILYLLEEKSQIDLSLDEQKRRINSKSIFISLDPTSTHFLKKRKISRRIPEDYYTKDEIETIKDDSIRYINTKVDAIDNYLLLNFPQLRQVKLARYNYYNFCSLLNILPVRLAVIDRIIKEEQPDEVVYFDSGIKNEEDDLFIKESTWGLAISIIVKTLNMKNKKIASPVEFGVEFEDSKILSQFNRVKRRLCGDYSEKIKRKISSFEEYFTTKKRYDMNLLFLTKGYDLEHLIYDNQGLKKYPVGLYLWNLDKGKLNTVENLRRKKDIYELSQGDMLGGFRKDANRIWEHVKDSDSFRQIFDFIGFNYFGEIEYKLNRIFSNNLAEMLFVDYALSIICKKFNIQAIISNDCHSYLRQTVFYHSQRTMPAIHFYHGPHYTHKTSYVNYCWWQSSEINLMFGEGLSELARKDNPKARYIPNGSICIDSIPVKRARKTTKKILYLFTRYSSNNFTFWSTIYYPENVHYYYQDRIINKLLEYPQYEIILKLHPSQLYKNPPMIERFKNISKGKVKIVKDAYYGDELIRWADLIILDMPGTCLLQSLKAGKPILLFCGLEYLLDRSIKDLVKKSVEYSEDMEAFLCILDRYLKDTNLWIAPDNDQFLRKCGTHLNDGKSCIRATQKILSIIKEQNSKT